MARGAPTSAVITIGHEMNTHATLLRSIYACYIDISRLSSILAHGVYDMNDNEDGHPQIDFTDESSFHKLPVRTLNVNGVQTAFKCSINIFTGCGEQRHM